MNAPIVAIDAGNTRIKWGVYGDGRWIDKGVVPTAEPGRLHEALRRWPAGARVVICNVAGASVRDALGAALQETFSDVLWFSATVAVCGVQSAYDVPEQLGADRWAALIGARGQTAAACLVVCAGTATTVDLLDASGMFCGGLILPGFDLMRAALARDTAQLPLAEGEFQRLPRNTMDAIISGCVQAQAGAVERMFTAIAGEPDAVCLLTGGAAPRLLPHLAIPLCVSENLILDGLVRYAASR